MERVPELPCSSHSLGRSNIFREQSCAKYFFAVKKFSQQRCATITKHYHFTIEYRNCMEVYTMKSTYKQETGGKEKQALEAKISAFYCAKHRLKGQRCDSIFIKFN